MIYCPHAYTVSHPLSSQSTTLEFSIQYPHRIMGLRTLSHLAWAERPLEKVFTELTALVTLTAMCSCQHFLFLESKILCKIELYFS